MKKNEQKLFLKLCRFKDTGRCEIEPLLAKYASPTVLGYLFYNRMHAVAYGILKENNLLGHVNREFKNALAGAYQQSIEKNRSFFQCLDILSEILNAYTGKYAMLKGALLCGIYPEGCRTSNDVDLLVMPEDVTNIGKILIGAGFQQGNVRNGAFVPAGRREIIESKMMRGETVPYILEVNLPYMRFLEVDINFSLDYKNGETDVISDMLNHTIINDAGRNKIITLKSEDFFIHLCGHLYKEAATLPWIKMKRDMTLYKFCDIYMMLHGMSLNEVSALYQRAEQLHMADICSAVITWTDKLFNLNNSFAKECAENHLIGKETILHEIIAPAERKKFIYTEKDICARFFSEDRTLLLTEAG